MSSREREGESSHAPPPPPATADQTPLAPADLSHSQSQSSSSASPPSSSLQSSSTAGAPHVPAWSFDSLTVTSPSSTPPTTVPSPPTTATSSSSSRTITSPADAITPQTVLAPVPSDHIFSPRPTPQSDADLASLPTSSAPLPPQQQQQQSQQASSSSSSSLFNTPNRSIFSSGPPTASVSASTAHASMSTPSPVRSGRPLSALNGSSTVGGSIRRNGTLKNLSTPRKSRMSRAEKDIDDPSVPVESNGAGDRRNSNTSGEVTNLFTSADGTIVSRNASYIRTNSGTAYTRATLGETAPLPSHLYSRGLLGGKHSDIIVHAFGTRYPLHRLLLDRAPFFSSALSEPWFESSSKEITLHPEDVDSNITQVAFELALKRLYGCSVTSEEDAESIGLFATACWLEMPDLIDASVASILRQMTLPRVGSLIHLVTSNYYGKPGERILASAKAMLCRDGWEMHLKHWDGVPGEIMREIIGGDGFFVLSEWERWLLARRVFDRKLKLKAIECGLMEFNGVCKRPPPDTMRLSAIRFDAVYRRSSHYGSQQLPEAYDAWLSLYTSPDISALLVLLDEGIHFVHLSFEQLQNIREQRDVLGLPLVPEKIIHDALWMQMELRQRVRNAGELDLELGLSQLAEDLPEEEGDDGVEAIATKGKGKDTGVVESADQELESGSWDGNGKPRKFWIPNLDSTSVMGGNPDAALGATSSPHRAHMPRLSASLDPTDVQWASDFGASVNERPTTSDRTEIIPPVSFTHFPPFRFAAEFQNVKVLREKKRTYSRTVWYAGSLWNVYIQKVEGPKNMQLGVYLHRAKEREGLVDERIGPVDERIGQYEHTMRRNNERRRRSARGDFVDEDHSTSSTDPDITLVASEPVSRPGTISSLTRGGSSSYNNGNNLVSSNTENSRSLTKSSQSPMSSIPDHVHHHFIPMSDSDENGLMEDPMSAQNREIGKSNRFIPTMPTYVDARPTIKTYFKIYSPSKGGRMLSVYESAPDLFNFSQSWGWKSSTMVLDDGLYGFDSGAENVAAKGSRGGSLRFMVVIGNV